jgi:hypothetical protein
MDKPSQRLLKKAAKPGGYADQSIDPGLAQLLKHKGLVTVREKLSVIREKGKVIGTAPIPHVEATDRGRIVAEFF